MDKYEALKVVYDMAIQLDGLMTTQGFPTDPMTDDALLTVHDMIEPEGVDDEQVQAR